MTADDRRFHIVHTEASAGWGGQEIRILTEAQGMIARGHRVEIWALPDSPILVEARRRGLTHRALPIGQKRLRGIRALRRALAAVRPDIVNAHSSIDAWLVAFARLTLRAPPPMVRTRHISASVPRDLATRWLYTRATRHIVTTGEALRHQLINDNEFPPEHLTSVPTGIDTDYFVPGDRHAARTRLKLPPDATMIGIVATLRSWKGHRYLIEACARLQDESTLIIVGDGPMRAEIERQVHALDIAQRVILPGNQRDVLPWLQALDIFVLPSYANEGVPQAIMQAMACGLPVVTTPVGGIAEAVQHEVTGIMVAPHHADEVHAALARLQGEPELRRRLGSAATAFARRNFGAERMLDAMERIFYSVAGKS